MNADDEEVELKCNTLKSVVRSYFQGELDMTEELQVEVSNYFLFFFKNFYDSN